MSHCCSFLNELLFFKEIYWGQVVGNINRFLLRALLLGLLLSLEFSTLSAIASDPNSELLDETTQTLRYFKTNQERLEADIVTFAKNAHRGYEPALEYESTLFKHLSSFPSSAVLQITQQINSGLAYLIKKWEGLLGLTNNLRQGKNFQKVKTLSEIVQEYAKVMANSLKYSEEMCCQYKIIESIGSDATLPWAIYVLIYYQSSFEIDTCVRSLHLVKKCLNSISRNSRKHDKTIVSLKVGISSILDEKYLEAGWEEQIQLSRFVAAIDKMIKSDSDAAVAFVGTELRNMVFTNAVETDTPEQLCQRVTTPRAKDTPIAYLGPEPSSKELGQGTQYQQLMNLRKQYENEILKAKSQLSARKPQRRRRDHSSKSKDSSNSAIGESSALRKRGKEETDANEEVQPDTLSSMTEHYYSQWGPYVEAPQPPKVENCKKEVIEEHRKTKVKVKTRHNVEPEPLRNSAQETAAQASTEVELIIPTLPNRQFDTYLDICDLQQTHHNIKMRRVISLISALGGTIAGDEGKGSHIKLKLVQRLHLLKDDKLTFVGYLDDMGIQNVILRNWQKDKSVEEEPEGVSDAEDSVILRKKVTMASHDTLLLYQVVDLRMAFKSVGYVIDYQKLCESLDVQR